MNHLQILVFLLVMGLVSHTTESWSWFSSSTHKTSTTDQRSYGNKDLPRRSNPDFSMEVLNNPDGTQLVRKMNEESDSCFQQIYRHLDSSCKNIEADDEKMNRFAWYLSDCFAQSGGRDPYPYCDENTAMINCRGKLTDHQQRIYLEYYLDINTICHQLQYHEFKYEVERLGNNLRRSAQATEEKLVVLRKKSDNLLDRSNLIHESMTSINTQVQSVVQSTQTLKEEMAGLTRHSMDIYQQNKDIAISQSELRDGQTELNNVVNEGKEMIKEGYKNINQGTEKLQNETRKIDKEINKIGDSMVSKMSELQSTADDIGIVAGSSLKNQHKLLDGQSAAIEGLQSLTRYQLEAFEDIRNTSLRVDEYGRQQLVERLNRQEEYRQVHANLLKNSHTMLEAQEVFKQKQANMLVAIEKLYALYNALLVHWRLIKTLIMYTISILIIHMFTSTKQTYIIRPVLYIVLLVALSIEVAIHQFMDDIDGQSWINGVRWLFALVALVKFLLAIFTYSDPEKLNHQMFLTLVDKINDMKRRIARDEDIDSDDIDWNLWVKTDLPDDVDELEDPDFPEHFAENAIANTDFQRTYNLRRRL